MNRVILHIDMDAFFASIEQLDNPRFKGKPVIVGGSKRGVVSTASYEAREFGVHSAIPIFEAKRLCPNGIYLPVRMSRYRELSDKIMSILDEFSPLVEQVSIDEAFIDISGTEKLHGIPEEVAFKIKTRIKEDTSLTCSIGIAPNKFLAKIASDIDKPDGLTIITGDKVQKFLSTLSVGKLPGVGDKTLKELKKLGIRFASDILKYPKEAFKKRFGKFGQRLIELAKGIDESKVTPYTQAKSISSEDTLPEDTNNLEVLKRWLMSQAEVVGRRLRKANLKGRTITLKLKYSDFRSVTRSRTINMPSNATKTIFDTASTLLENCGLPAKVRLVGVGVSNFEEPAIQYQLFDSGDIAEKKLQKVDQAIDQVTDKFGIGIIKRGTTADIKD